MALTDKQIRVLRARPVGANGNHLKAAMTLVDVTQQELAAATGLAQGYISNLATGKHAVTVANAHKFAEYFGCAIEDLFPAAAEVA